MNRSTPGLPVHHQLPEFTETHVHRVIDAIQPSHPLSSPSPPAPNPSQHQSLFQWVNSSHEVAKVLEFLHRTPALGCVRGAQRSVRALTAPRQAAPGRTEVRGWRGLNSLPFSLLSESYYLNWLPGILKYHIKHFLPFERNTLAISGQCYSWVRQAGLQSAEGAEGHTLSRIQGGILQRAWKSLVNSVNPIAWIYLNETIKDTHIICIIYSSEKG